MGQGVDRLQGVQARETRDTSRKQNAGEREGRRKVKKKSRPGGAFRAGLGRLQKK